MIRLLSLVMLFWMPLKGIKPDKDPYYVKMKGFEVITLNTKKIELGVTAVFFNTYNAKAKLEEVQIDVWLEGQYLGKVSQAEEVSIPKQSAFDIPLILKLEPPGPAIKNTLWQSGRLLTGKKVKVFYKGYIKMKAIGFIPIKVPMEDKVEFGMSEIW